MRNRIEPTAYDRRTTGRRSRLPRIVRYGSGIALALLIAACQQPIELADQIEQAVNDANAGEQPPAAPSDLQANAADGVKRIEVTWTDNSDNETEFQIARQISSKNEWQTVGSTLADSTSYPDDDDGLQWTTSYDYRVRAVNAAGSSAWTETVSATTDAEPVDPPSAPTGVQAQAQGAGEILITWPDLSSSANDLELHRSVGDQSNYEVIQSTDDLEPTDTTYVDSDVDSETQYWYRLRALNSAGASGWATTATTTPSLEAPTDVQVTALSDSELLVSWIDESDYEDGFEIRRDGVVSATVAADEGSYRDFGLNADSTFEYAVRAVDSNGSDWTVASSGTTMRAAATERTVSVGVQFDERFVPPKETSKFDLVRGFWIGETEVTYALWSQVRDWAESKAGYQFANQGQPGNYGDPQSDQHPVTNINWRDAMAWTNALTEYYNFLNNSNLELYYYEDDSHTTPIRRVDNTPEDDIDFVPGGSQYRPQAVPARKSDADGFRLPQEPEWEIAARYISDFDGDGDITGVGEAYPMNYASGADDSTDNQSATEAVAWYEVNSQTFTKEVATQVARNALGLADMSGNVTEWIDGRNTDSDVSGIPDSDEYGYRGGAFDSPASRVEVGRHGETTFFPVAGNLIPIFEGYNDPSHEKSANRGFRVVRTGGQ